MASLLDLFSGLPVRGHAGKNPILPSYRSYRSTAVYYSTGAYRTLLASKVVALVRRVERVEE